jgi:hypothetical protein
LQKDGIFGISLGYDFLNVYPELAFQLLTSSQLATSRNLIYAIHGYAFKTSPWKEFFQSKSWYHPDPGFSESQFTAAELKNLATIRKVEAQRNTQ